MLMLPATMRVLLYREPVDMRRSFDGLECLVRDGLGEDPLSGSLFVFSNRRRDRAKLLLWDGSGFWIWYKRLEEGTFHFPWKAVRSRRRIWCSCSRESIFRRPGECIDFADESSLR